MMVEMLGFSSGIGDTLKLMRTLNTGHGFNKLLLYMFSILSQEPIEHLKENNKWVSERVWDVLGAR